MTEEEWNAATDPKPKLEFLRGKASERKLRLIGRPIDLIGILNIQQLIGRDDFEGLLRSLAGALFQQAETKLRSREWREISLDVRFDNCGGHNSKIRAVHSGDFVVITMPADMTLLVLSLDSMRRELQQDRWYGFRLTVTADQQCDMVYNYDPNCASDPTFYLD